MAAADIIGSGGAHPQTLPHSPFPVSYTHLMCIRDSFEQANLYCYTEFVSLLKHWRIEIIHSFHRPYENRRQSNALAESPVSYTHLDVYKRQPFNTVRYRKEQNDNVDQWRQT